ncbi:MAG: hypothetical protein JW782_02475 [Candidatus Saganbacteria bacterium]|nr:hypothetical protein [Candidatus Saganbacteria bacterium]
MSGVTLVAHYGLKSEGFHGYIRRLQSAVRQNLGPGLSRAFQPYVIDQVHLTLVGLEGERVGNRVFGSNYLNSEANIQSMDLRKFLRFVRRTDLLPFELQLGGFQPDRDYNFRCFGEDPYTMSFSFRGDLAVAIGWQMQGEEVRHSLLGFREAMAEFRIIHKYPDDNDGFFVLGRLDRSGLDNVQQAELAARLQTIEGYIRAALAADQPFILPIDRENISVVQYQDSTLPRGGTRFFPLLSRRLTPGFLRSLY